MKFIDFKNKHQKDRIKKCCDFESISLREKMNNKPEYLFNNSYQIKLVNSIYLQDIKNIDNSILKLFNSEINNKINSYNNQDIIKNLKNDNIIIFDNLIEKLVISKLKCCFCNNIVKIFYKEVRDNLQWTLDRIDNNKPHTIDNVNISCLKCNIQRRNRNHDKFLLSKQMKINKIY
jgi:hypothetical protein